MKTLYSKYKNTFNLVLRWLIFFAAGWFIVQKLLSDETHQRLPDVFAFDTFQWLMLGIVFLLMFLNWGIEAYKWRILVMKFTDISFRKSFLAVLGGLASTAWVPNRLGEFVGRSFFVEEKNKSKAVSSTIVGNMAQLLITLTLGMAATFLWANKLYNLPGFYFVIILFVDGVAVYLFFKLKTLYHWAEVRNMRISTAMEYFKDISSIELLTILLLALSRFLVYVFQYLILLYLFDVYLPVWEMSLHIVSIFFIQSILPAISITELATRGAAILFVFEQYQFSGLALLSAAYSLWFINVLIPTLVGAVSMITIKKNRQK